jgi:hypothetical protein
METIYFSETLPPTYKSTWRQTPSPPTKKDILFRRENLKNHIHGYAGFIFLQIYEADDSGQLDVPASLS